MYIKKIIFYILLLVITNMTFSIYATNSLAVFTDKIDFNYNYIDEFFNRDLNSYQLAERFKSYKIIYSPIDPNITYNKENTKVIYHEDNINILEAYKYELNDKLEEGYYRLCVVLNNQNIYCNKDAIHIFYDNKSKPETKIDNWSFDVDTIDNKIIVDWDKSTIPTNITYKVYYSDNVQMKNKKNIEYTKNLRDKRYEIDIEDIIYILDEFEEENIEKIYINFCIGSETTNCSEVWEIKTSYAQILLDRKLTTDSKEKNEKDIIIESDKEINSNIDKNDNLNSDENQKIEKQLTASITDNITFPKELLFFVVAIVIIVVTVVFFLDKLKEKIFTKKKLNIGQEISKMNNNLIINKLGKIYINNIYELYKRIKDNSYIVSPIFLTNLIISLKSRGLVIILGGNGIGKTALVENLVKGLYLKNANKYILKVVIKESTDSSKKFIGMYDRLNNNYIDPYGVTKFINKAYRDSENPYFLLMDEINTQNIEKFFPYILDIDTILNQGESNFIKVGEISDADKESLKKRKLKLTKEYNFLIEKNDGIHYFGYKIPKNLYIIGTANVDKFAEPFSGKLLDRSDIIKMKYMGDKSYDEEEKKTLNLNIDIIRDSNIIGKETINVEILEFIEKLKEIWPISKRTEKSILYYQILIDEIKLLNLSFVIQQKLLPLAFGDKYKKPLQELIKVCHKYNKQINLKAAIKDIEKLLDDEFINFWKIK